MNDRPRGQDFSIPDSITNLIRLASLIAIALGLFAAVLGATAAYVNLSAQLHLERSERAALAQADRVAEKLGDVLTSLRDASVVDTARSGNPAALRTALRERGINGIVDVQVLPASVDDIALSENIDLDFAAAELVFEAIRHDQAESRVLQPGTPAESLAFARRLPGGGNVMLLRQTVSVLTSLLQDNAQLDFLALAQHNEGSMTILAARGHSTAAPIRDIPIEGSQLTLQWSRALLSAPMDNRMAVIIGCTGIIMLMLGLLMRRRTRLAQVLSAEREPENRPRPDPRPEPKPSAARSAQAPQSTHGTVVLDQAGREHDDSATTAAPQQRDWQAPRESINAPDLDDPGLPEWLRDGQDEDLDTLLATQDNAAMADDPAAGRPAEAGAHSAQEPDGHGVHPTLFTDEGIHGVVEQELDSPAALLLGRAIASTAAERDIQRLYVAHDGRESGPKLLGSLIEGLNLGGIDVIDLGASPAPFAWFGAMRAGKAGAVVLTGGERPEEVNGLEIVLDGHWLSADDQRQLFERIRTHNLVSGTGRCQRGDEAEAYGEQLAARYTLNYPLRVVLDCGNPVNGAVAPRLLEALDVDVIPLNSDAETNPAEVGGFSGSDRERDLKLCVYNFAADLGITLDRTASRLRVIDGKGEPVTMACLGTLLLSNLAASNEEPIVVAEPGLCAGLAAATTTEARLIACEDDRIALHQRMREHGAALGLRADGSVYSAADWHGLPDGLHAAAWLLSVLGAEDRPVAETLQAAGHRAVSERPDT